jgi:hypothetical protein
LMHPSTSYQNFATQPEMEWVNCGTLVKFALCNYDVEMLMDLNLHSRNVSNWSELSQIEGVYLLSQSSKIIFWSQISPFL